VPKSRIKIQLSFAKCAGGSMRCVDMTSTSATLTGGPTAPVYGRETGAGLNNQMLEPLAGSFE